MEHESGCNGPCIRQNAFDYWLWERCAAKSERELISNRAEETGGEEKGIRTSREKEQEYKKKNTVLKENANERLRRIKTERVNLTKPSQYHCVLSSTFQYHGNTMVCEALCNTIWSYLYHGATLLIFIMDCTIYRRKSDISKHCH